MEIFSLLSSGMPGLSVSVIIFAVEILLSVVVPVAVVVLLFVIMKTLKQIAGNSKSKSTPAATAEMSSVQAQSIESELDDSELVAVITAAIHAYETAQGNSTAGNLVVRSIKQRNRW